MKDRESTHPGRVKLTPVEGLENVFILERMDEPTIEGTLLNTQNILPDKVVVVLGLDPANNPVPADAFRILAEKGTGPAISSLRISESDEEISVTASLASGGSETISVAFDEDGRTSNITVDGKDVPVTWEDG